MKQSRTFRSSIGVAALVLLASAATVNPQSAKMTSTATFEGTVQPFLVKNCQSCHNSKTSMAGLNVEAFKDPTSLLKDRDRWEQIAAKIASGEMPPPGVPRPDPISAQSSIDWLRTDFTRQDKLIPPDPGRIVARRLNRAEYNNTVRDLLGVSFKPAEDFPQDDSGYGFDNIGDVLSLSPALMEKYLNAAERVSRAAVFGEDIPKPSLDRFQPGSRRGPPPASLLEYDESGLSLLGAINKLHRFPVDAEYLFKFTLNGGAPAGSEARTIAVWLDGKQIKQFVIDTTVLEGQSRQFRTRVPKGEHLVSVSFLKYYEGLPPAYRGPNPSTRPIPPPRIRPGAAAPTTPAAAGATPAVPQMTDGGRVEAVDIGGPFDASSTPSLASQKLIFTCSATESRQEDSCARKIVSDLANRTYRRPVTSQEVANLLGLYRKVRENGDSFKEGIAVAIQYMLVSPDFLFRIAGTNQAKASVSPVSQYEMASRLSYFLWSSMPDEELRRLASQGQLKNPAVVDAQVRRMLKDPKSEALIDNFAGQWLETRNMDIVKPDRVLFAQFDDLLRMSMKTETKLFLSEIVQNDRSILDIISGKFTYVNERLAQFYKMPGISGPEFRRVDLGGNQQRGGILTQASILTVSSYATRTSPVLRGKWILDNILNTPPAPAPPDVPTLSVEGVGASVSLRQQMEAHRANPACGSCHGKMDPLGFGLENYDAIGAWRSHDGKVQIDASGKLPDGKTFSNPDQLKAILLSNPDFLAQSISEKLLIYALGRGLERFDRPAVAAIVKQAAAKQYRFSSIVLGIVHSMPFERQRGDQISHVRNP